MKIMDTITFYQSVTAHHFYVSSSKDLRIVDVEIIRGIRAYYVEWIYGGSKNRVFLSSDEMKLIADAMGMFYASTCDSCKAWKELYLICSHAEKNELQSV